MNTSAKIAIALEQATGRKAKRFPVKMRGCKEVAEFIRTLQIAQKRAAQSKIRYGDSLDSSTEQRDS
jgi:hypothetical protein